MLLVILLLLAWPLAADSIHLVVTCQGKGDLHKLLFSICDQDLLCRFLYSLDSRASKFHHQLNIFDLFVEDALDNHTLLWSGDWRPIFEIHFNATAVPCHDSFNVTNSTDLETSLFHFYALERMTTHKQYISRHHCGHRNERLLFDKVSNLFRCHCPSDKLCDDVDGLHRDVLTLIHCLLLGLFFLILVALLYVSIRLMKQ